MAFLSIIGRWASRQHLSIRQIAWQTKLSRNTIRKYLRLGAVAPEFRVSGRPNKPDPYAAKLAGWLKTEAATAPRIEALEHHRRKGRFFSTIELVNALEREKAKGKAGQIAQGVL